MRNANAELKAKKDFEGNMTAVSYDTKTRTKKISYADGTENIIVYDECGNVLSATNESGTLSYIYDKAGFLTKETDEKTGENVNYFYDKAGRRTRLLSKERDISYNYGKNSELLAQKDRAKQLEVTYKYDISGREIERRFGNGVKQLTFYDKAGRTVCIKQVNSSDRLLSGESYVYDKSGRRSLTVNEKGLITIYKYDNQSRLETVFYPFNEDIKETARKEAEKQGLYFLSTQGNPENYFLSSVEMMQLKAAAERIASGRSGAITVNQIVWRESYTYDPNGNRTSKTTAWGTVAYSYDKENRLVESGELGKTESVKYTYDANGNLLRESAARYRKDYVYNAQNRMAFSDVQDSVANTRNLTEYAYDSFGRRIETREILGNYSRNLYDGFSFDIIGQSDLTETPLFNVSSENVRTRTNQVSGTGTSQSASTGRNSYGTEIGTRYRYIDDTPLVPFSENATSSSAGTTAQNRSRPSNEYVLYSYGEPIATTADGNTSYFGTDILGSVRSVTDKYGTVQSEYNYDVFGSPYLSNLDNDMSFGYCGKIYDNGTGLYDYGFRDYSPNQARFTTIDPIRDGANWFSYVVNDPVNYVDPFGLWDEKVHFEDTKEWAKEVFGDDSSGSKKAEAIAKADNNTDKGSKGPMPWQDQSYHFNTSDAPSGSSGDTRIQHSEEHLEKAINLQNEANSLRENKTAIGIINKFNDWRADKKEENALNELGEGLHALQDVSAHTDEYVHDMWYGKSHSDPKNPFDNGNNLADDPSVNPERYAKVKEDTINYLNRFKEATKTKCGK